MMRLVIACVFVLMVTACATASVPLAVRGRAAVPILTQPGATPTELLAARELADALRRVTGATFEVREASGIVTSGIVVGQGAAATAACGELVGPGIGGETSVIGARGQVLVLAGGRPRGTLYAVYRFLHTVCGVRWWTPWASRYPSRPTLSAPEGVSVHTPAFESRDPFWFPAFDGVWAARNGSNSASARLTDEQGGKIVYKGFVHTFYPLVPPTEHFQAHPEWYSLINGKRTADNAQLCTTNPELREFMVGSVRRWLKESPEARIVSISQNDCFNACQCAACRAVDDREGSHSGTMLELVNFIAQRLGPEFPEVAFDTLAYQYTRSAPKTVKPLPNVIVRLCSIECNFAATLEDPSNTKFADDIRNWNRLSQRLYIWDYTTNFGHYVLPHPNWFVLGPNVRFFQKYGVKGLFEQGAYQSFGSEMSELRAWLLARLLLDPAQDDRALIGEFLDGYYGKSAARSIRAYMKLMSDAARGFSMSCFASPNAPYTRFAVLSKAESLWQQAEAAAKGDADLVWRIRQARLPIWYAWLVRWNSLRRECLRAGAAWPVPTSRKAMASQWLAAATGPGPQGWAAMTHVNEGGTTPEQFAARFAVDEPDPSPAPAPVSLRRSARPAPPADLPGAHATGAIDVQDDRARLYEEGVCAEVMPDAAASDGAAVRMPGEHREWAYQVPIDKLPARVLGRKWAVYAVVRVEPAPGADGSGQAFTAGVYDTAGGGALGQVGPSVAEAGAGYRTWKLATVVGKAGQYVWVAPPASPAVKAVWVDRVWLEPEA